MKIGFLIERNIYYKNFSPIIDEALKRGNEVFCLHDYSQPRQGKKAYQFPDIKKIPNYKYGKPIALSYNGIDKLLREIKKRKIQVIVSLHFSKQHIELRSRLKKQGIYWIALQSSFDTVVFAEYLDYPDKYLIYTYKWLDLILDFKMKNGLLDYNNREKEKQRLKKYLIPIGFPELDAYHNINKVQAKKELGIPLDKRVVLFLPFPFGSSNGRFWAPFIYGRKLTIKAIINFLRSARKFRFRHLKQIIYNQTDKTLVKAIKKFCVKNNAYLLVKSRKKDLVRKYLVKIADKVLYDNEFYPSTILKCFSVSDLCVHFYSSAVFEAVYCNVPSLCIAPSVKDWESIQDKLWEMILQDQNYIFNFKDASYSISIPEAINDLPNKNFKDFRLDKDARDLFIKEFVGNKEQWQNFVVNNNLSQYSKNAVDVIENLIATTD